MVCFSWVKKGLVPGYIALNNQFYLYAMGSSAIPGRSTFDSPTFSFIRRKIVTLCQLKVGDICMGCMFVYSQNIYCEFLTPHMIMIWNRDFGRWLNHEGGALINGFNALITNPRELTCSFCQVEDTAAYSYLWTMKLSFTRQCQYHDLGNPSFQHSEK